MATYSLVHGARHGGWAWDLVRAQNAYPAEHAHLAERLRPQSPLTASNSLLLARSLYAVCGRDGCIRPEWRRSGAVNPVELDAGHPPTLECPAAPAELLEP